MIFPDEYECSRSWLVRNSCAACVERWLVCCNQWGKQKEISYSNFVELDNKK